MAEEVLETANKNPWMDGDYNTCSLASHLGVAPSGLTLQEMEERAEEETKAPVSGTIAVSTTYFTTYLRLEDTDDTTYEDKKGFIPTVNADEDGLVLKENWPFPSGGVLYEPLFCKPHHKLQWGWKTEESAFLGKEAGINVTSEGTGNTLLGYRSGYKLTVEKGNTFTGKYSGYLVGDIEGTEETIETSSYDIKETEEGTYFQRYMPLTYWDGQLVTLNLTGTTTGYDIMGSSDGVTWNILKSTTGTNTNPTGSIPSTMASYKGSVWYSIYNDTAKGIVQQWDGSTLTGHLTSGYINVDHLYSWGGKLWAIRDAVAGSAERIISWTTGSATWTAISDYDTAAYYDYNSIYNPSQYWGQKVNHLFAFEDSLYWLCSRYNSTSTKWEGKILKWDGTSAFDVYATIAPTDSYLHTCGAVNVSGTVYLFMSEFGSNGSLSATDYKLVVYTSTDMLTWTFWKDFGDIGLVCDAVYFNQRIFLNILNPSNNYTEVYYLGIGDRSLTKEVSITADTQSNSGTFAQLGGYLYVGKYKGIYRRTASTWIQAIEPGDTFGSYNTFDGYGVGISNVTGRFLTLIGTLSDVANPELENATAIGYRAIVGESNTIVLGGTGVYAVNVCIGKTGGAERLDVSGNIKASGQFISGQATGTAPASVQSTTVCTNLNADLLDGYHATAFLGLALLTDPGADRIVFWDDSETNLKWLACGNSVAITTTTLDTIQDIRTSASPSFVRGTFTQADGTSPFAITSTTVNTNLNADLLDGNHSTAFATSGHDHDSAYISIIAVPGTNKFPYQTAGGELIDSTYSAASFETAGAVTTHEGTYNHANYNTAYGWGNHALGGYLTSVTAHDLLSATHGDTTAAAVSRGAMIAGIGVTPKWTLVAAGTAGYVWTMGANEPGWAEAAAGSAPLGLGDLVDPNADRIFFWDDSEGASKWLACGNSVAITVTTLDTIQDIRTTAGPTFDHVHFGTQSLVNIASNIAISDGITARTSGNYNTFVGVESGHSLTTGLNNVGIGYTALWSLTSGIDNVAIGYATQDHLTEGNYNTAIGMNAQTALTSGSYNCAIGFGVQGALTTGTVNNAFGFQAQNVLTIGNFNNAFGYQSQFSLTEADYNDAFGRSALYSITTGFGNIGFGAYSGYSITTTHSGVFLGYKAGYYETVGDKLFIDDRQRASEADGRIKALIYGIFADATANQYLNVNGHLNALEDISIAGTKVLGAQGLAVADATAVSGTATSGGYGFVSAAEMNTAITNINTIQTQLNALIARCEAHGLIAS